MSGLTATFISTVQFSVVGDYEELFNIDRITKANCGVDGYKFGTINTSTYSDPTTTITLDSKSDDLTANLSEVWVGVQSPGVSGSIPDHTHLGIQGDGGTLAISAASREADNRLQSNINSQILSVSAASVEQDKRERAETNVQILSVSAASVEQDKRLQATIDALTTDHGELIGLEDDDHQQYSLINGARDFTGTVGGVPATASTDFPQKLYVDNVSAALYENIYSVSAASIEANRTHKIWADTMFASISAASIEQDKRERAETNVQILSVSASSVKQDRRLQSNIDNLTTDHGELTGLEDDDHTQYYNEARGDTRYAAYSVSAASVEQDKREREATNVQIASVSAASVEQDNRLLPLDGSRSMEGNLQMNNGLYLETDEVRARDSGGLKLTNDAGTEGMLIDDTGKVWIGNGQYLLTDAIWARDSGGLYLRDDAGNLGIYIEDGGKVSLVNGTNINEFSIDGTLAGNSDDVLSTEKAVKTYIDNISIVNLGTGEGVYYQESGQEFQLKSLKAGNNIILTGDSTSIEISAAHIRGEAGIVALANGVSTKTVSFDTSAGNAFYSVSVSLSNTIDANPSIYGMTITEKTKDGFTVTFSGVIDSANYILEWSVNQKNIPTNNQYSTMPAGAILSWVTSAAPAGWLECNGSAVSRTAYDTLFDVIGEQFGNGDGSTTFNLPDLRGEFLRGWDHGAGNDPDAGSRDNRGDAVRGDHVGTAQEEGFESHRHDFYVGHTTQGYGHLKTQDQIALADNIGGRFAKSGQTGSQTIIANTGGTETRPRNIYVMWIIKYTTPALGLTTDHGDLLGIYDDDHTQYSLVDGTRTFSGVVSGINPSAAAPAALATKEYVDSIRSYVKVSDVKSVGTNGGTFTQGAWRIRDLNTKDSDPDGICSLSSNQITLIAGTYECRIAAPAYECGVHQTILYNTTGATSIMYGTSEYNQGAGGSLSTNKSFISGRFTIATGQAIEVRHWCGTTQNNNGFGVATNLVSELYTVAEFWKVG